MRDAPMRSIGQWCTIALFALAAGARLFAPGLHSLDDCFYARKGVEMLRSGSWLTVYWNGAPTWQNPPLQFDWIAASFRFFGCHDAAARLPQLAMAIALLPLTAFLAWRLGLTAMAGSLAVALLATSPYLLRNAARVMLDVPAAFWCTACIAAALWSRSPGVQGGAMWKRTVAAVLLALSIAAAMLTKSLLGLTALGVLGVTWLLHVPRRLPRAVDVLTILAGLLFGSIWYVHQAWRFGREALNAHFLTEIYVRSSASIPWIDRLTAYPLALLRDFQPWILPALVGAVVLLRSPTLRTGPLVLLPAWLLAPPLVFSLSSAQRPAYLAPLVPAIALAAAFWIERRWPRAAALMARRLLPGVLVGLAVVGLVRPAWLGRPQNAGMIAAAPQFETAVPVEHAIPSHHVSYWRVVNPLLYYADRMLAMPADLEPALRAARAADGVVVVGPAALAAIQAAAPGAESLARDRDWVLVRLPRP